MKALTLFLLGKAIVAIVAYPHPIHRFAPNPVTINTLACSIIDPKEFKKEPLK